MTVQSKPLKVFLDDRGYLFEMARMVPDGIDAKQVTISNIFPGAIKAFHKHEKQTDYVTCVSGNVKLITFKLDIETGEQEELKIICFGDKSPQLVTIPPGYYHGYTPLGNSPATIVYITNQVYDVNDEFRLDWNFFGERIWQVDNK